MGKRVNTTKKERQELLKRLGYTEEQMQAFWNEAATVNSKVAMLQRAGHKWTDLCVWQMEELPGLAERTRQQLEEKKLKEQKEQDLKKQIEEQRAYYKEHFEEIMCNKILNKEPLTEEEIRNLAYYYEKERVWSADDIGRWQIPVTSIIKINGQLFGIHWFKGLTESQEDYFDEQPFKVEPVKKMVEITVWNKV